MRKLSTLLLLLLVVTRISAQISITQNDMPHTGDSARYTTAAPSLLLNYAATGPNYTWDFRNLRAASQGLDQYQSPFSANLIYGLYFLNLPFNPNRASVASNTTELPTSALVPLTNPYNFYHLSATQYKQVGFGSEFSNIPVPVTYNNKDVIYKLPIVFGNKDTSDSDWSLSVPNVGYMGYTQKRINNVDGWGTIRTPFGTFNVVRVKTTRIQKDTISINALNFALPRLVVNEYKWLANGEIFPILKVTTQSIFGLEIITDIKFRDDYIKIETNALTSSTFCAGSTVSIPYTKFGTFNPSALFYQGNIFTAQLSDSSGSFATPVNIGTLTSALSGFINATIPTNTIPGNHYRIRVVSSNLPVIGSDNGADITIQKGLPVINNITASDSLEFCFGNSVTLSIDADPGFTYQWFKNGSALNGTSSPSFLATEAGTYAVAVSNLCGTVNSASVIVTVDSLPEVMILNTSPGSHCYGDSITLTSSSSNATGYQWLLNGNPITGEINAVIHATQIGDFSLLAINNCGSVLSSPLNLQFSELPQIDNIYSSSNGLCNGDSVLLTSEVLFETSLQWQYNGIDIPGATDSMLYVNQSGNYSLIAVNSCSSDTSSLLSISINIPPQQPLVSAINDTLYSTVATSYQWKYSGQILPGANSQTYVPTLSGTYTVIITDANGCTSESAEFGVVLAGLSSISKTDIRIYPNPVSGNFLTLEWQNSKQLKTISIENMLGQQIKNIPVNENENKIYIPVNELEPGLYNFHCITQQGEFKYLFMRQ